MPYLWIVIVILLLPLIKPLRPAKTTSKTLVEAHDIEAHHTVESL